jgi:Tfp pilus assembly protein PilO
MSSTDSSRRPLAAVIVLLAALASLPWQVWHFVIEPQRDKRLETAELELRKIDKRVEQSHAAQRKYAQFHEEVDRLRKEVTHLSRILPRESAETPYPEVLSSAARKYGVTLTSVTPRIPRKDLVYVERRYDLEAAGTLPALVAWLGAFERNRRIVALPRIELCRDGSEWRANAMIVVPYERKELIRVD